MLFTLKKVDHCYLFISKKKNKNYKVKRITRHANVENVIKNKTLELLRRSSHYTQIRKKFKLRLKLTKQSDDLNLPTHFPKV